MKFITDAFLVNDAMRRYAAFTEPRAFHGRRTNEQKEILAKLESLQGATLEEARKAVPTPPWLLEHEKCDSCDRLGPTVQFGEDDYEDVARHFCPACLRDFADNLERLVQQEALQSP